MRLTNYSKMGRDVKKACSMYALAPVPAVKTPVCESCESVLQLNLDSELLPF